KLSERIGILEDDLKQTKLTYSAAVTKLILRVKKLEAQVKAGKARKIARVVLSVSLNLLCRTRKLGHSTMELRQESNASFGIQDLCLRQELLEYMDVHDNDASESSQPSWGKISKLEYKFQDQENFEDIFSFGSALEDVIYVVFVQDRNICLWLHTLHAKPWENEFESFSGQSLSKYIRQLILYPHEIQLNHSFFHLFSDEIMSDVDVFRPGVRNIVAAKSYGTLVVTVQRDAIVSKAII
ncbi:hypothetical protein Tco_0216348, partial [Tanacetum coccineum]